MSQIQLYYILSRSYLIQQSQHIQQCNKFNSLIWFKCLISCNSPTYPNVQQSQWSYLVLHSHLLQQSHTFNSLISCNSPTYPKVQQSQCSYLVLHSHLIKPFHILNSLTNSVLLSNFTFSSHSTVPHIQQCHKFNCLISFYILIYSKVYKFTSFIWFHSIISFKVPHIQKCNKVNGLISFYILISFNSPTYSTVSQIQLYYILSRSYLIQQSQHIQQCYKFNRFIWFNSLISCNSPTYPNVQQSQWSYLVLHSHLIKQFHTFNSVTHSTVSQIQLSYLVLHSHLLQQSHLFNSVTNSVVLSNFTFISHSTLPHIQQCHKFSCII